MNTVINKEQVIKEVAKREGIPLSTLQSVYWTLENYIFETLSSATPTEKIELKLKGELTFIEYQALGKRKYIAL